MVESIECGGVDRSGSNLGSAVSRFRYAVQKIGGAFHPRSKSRLCPWASLRAGVTPAELRIRSLPYRARPTLSHTILHLGRKEHGTLDCQFLKYQTPGTRARLRQPAWGIR